MMTALVLAAQIERCAPQVAPATMAAIVKVESGGDALAIHHNTVMRSYHPRDRAAPEALSQLLLAAGHSVDLGIAQINDVNLVPLGLNVRTVFDACTNIGAGSRILSRDYAFAARRYGQGQLALRHAIGMYNTGRLDAGKAYVQSVLQAAGISEVFDPKPPLIPVMDPMHSPLLVRVAITARPFRHSRAHAIMTPSRAPILIRFARSQVAVF